MRAYLSDFLRNRIAKTVVGTITISQYTYYSHYIDDTTDYTFDMYLFPSKTLQAHLVPISLFFTGLSGFITNRFLTYNFLNNNLSVKFLLLSLVLQPKSDILFY